MVVSKSKFVPVSQPSITEKELEYVADAVQSGWVSSLGPYLARFEKSFAEYIGVKYALAVSNGTVGLHLALATLRVGDGDEVIIPDLTFIATANAVAYTGATPVPVDIDPQTWCMDPRDVTKAVTCKTKAIIPVHLYGHPADMNPLSEIAQSKGLYVIEDSAEAHGAEYRGKRVGGLGTCAVFSFYGNKIITTGEGGMITTNEQGFYERAKCLRDHAMSESRRYWHTEIGFNYRMTNLQAALGLAQLERIEQMICKKRQIFEWYKHCLKGLKGVSLNPEMPWARNVFWMVCLVLESDVGVRRDELMAKLKDERIDVRPFFYPVSQMPMYCDGTVNSVAYNLSERGLNLPSGVGLEKTDVEFVAAKIANIIKGKLCPSPSAP
ncbi:MAG: DegT/DnrJ/EryC1/StrS family aminotransferase [Planctomycetota bacterium]